MAQLDEDDGAMAADGAAGANPRNRMDSSRRREEGEEGRKKVLQAELQR
jgi:hypothetical protein